MAIKRAEKAEKREVSFDGIPPTIEKVTEDLSCELTQVEWDNRARELAEANKEVARKEANKKSVTKELGHDVDLAKAKQNKLADVVSTRFEQREITVEVTSDFEAGFVIRRRTDTNVEIGRREMTTLERQGSLLDANDFIEGRHENA